MSEGMEILPGGRLIETYWYFDEIEQKGEYRKRDVTDRAIRNLWNSCTLAKGVTLRDIFMLIDTQLPAFSSVLGDWCDLIVLEGLKPYVIPEEENDIEYLELYWEVNQTDDDTITGLRFPAFHGVGYVLEEDTDFAKKGSRVNYAVELTAAYKLSHLPLNLRPKFAVHPDISAFIYGNEYKPIIEFKSCEYTLGDILYGIVWELTWFGPPEQRELRKEEFDAQIEEIQRDLADEIENEIKDGDELLSWDEEEQDVSEDSFLSPPTDQLFQEGDGDAWKNSEDDVPD